MSRKGETVGLPVILMLLAFMIVWSQPAISSGPGNDPTGTGGTPSPLAVNDWTNMNPGSGPSARFGHSMVYASWSDKIVLFGGRTVAGQNDQTWVYSYNTNTWTFKWQSYAPSPRYLHSMAYDSQSNRVILFGGYLSDFLMDTWAYNPSGDYWSEVSPFPSPAPRIDSFMAYDEESDRIVLYGGLGEWGTFNDTWTYDFNSNSWTDMKTDGPGLRYAHSMTYDSASDKVVLFGGWAPGYSDETWTYDYNTNSWANMNPTTKPSGRSDAPIVYSPRSDRVYVFGGLGFTRFSDTWAYNMNTNSWTNINPATKPAARDDPAMAYDSESGVIVLFGGETATSSFNDTWTFEVSSSLPSAPRNLNAVAGNNTVNLTWQPPADSGGSPITNYTVYRGTLPDGETQLATIGNFLIYNDTGLTNGQTYYYIVAAMNAIGKGANSSEVSATPAAPPGAPKSLAAVAGDTQVTLNWQAPGYDGGTAITNYTVYRGTVSGGETFLIKLGNVQTHLDIGLTNGQTYYYQVSASNAFLEGPRSTEASVTPAAPTAPGAPRNLAAIGGNKTVALSWSPPASDGRSPITKYSLYRGTASGSLTFLTDVTGLSHTDLGLTNDVTYYYQVSASNAVGEGPRSAEVSATPTEFVDTEPPVISISTPTDGATVSSAVVAVGGTASDNVGVSKVEISTDGISWVLATGTTSWSGELTLVAGSNSIRARATDTSGNVATATVVVSFSTGGTGGGPDSSTQSLAVIAGIIVLVIALAVTALFVMRKKKRQSKDGK